jgi:hypothetical protein
MAVAIVAAALALSVGLPALASTVTSHWRVEYRLPASDALLGQMTAPARNDAWAVGATAPRPGDRKLFLLHWTGHGWHQVIPPHPAGFLATQLLSSSPGNVWVFGETPVTPSPGVFFYVLVYNGSHWTTRALPASVSSTGPAVVLGSADAWAQDYGSGGCTYSDGSPQCTTVLEHWNGTTWTPSTIPTYEQALAGAGRHVWLAGLGNVKNPGGRTTGLLALYTWSAGQWQQVQAPQGEIGAVMGLAVSPGGRMWLMTIGTYRKVERLSYWNGRTWATSRIPSGLSFLGPSLTYDGHDGVWAGPYAHWTGKRWISTVPVPFTLGVYTVAPIPGTNSAWGNGQAGTPRSVIEIYGPLP